MAHNFSNQLGFMIDRAKVGNQDDIDYIMKKLNKQTSLAMTRCVDFALSLVENTKGVDQIKYYLFNGSLIQRNYASLFFNRLGEWEIVKEAYDKGLIDEIQAYAR